MTSESCRLIRIIMQSLIEWPNVSYDINMCLNEYRIYAEKRINANVSLYLSLPPKQAHKAHGSSVNSDRTTFARIIKTH